MTSYLASLDHSGLQRQEMPDLMGLFGEQESRDELGLGRTRDAFGELLFPGRWAVDPLVRYFLIVPWIYPGREAGGVPAAGAKARRAHPRREPHC